MATPMTTLLSELKGKNASAVSEIAALEKTAAKLAKEIKEADSSLQSLISKVTGSAK